jgi:hypothetical protein
MAKALKECGFSVMLVIDFVPRVMKAALDAFGKQIARDSVDLLFHAGYGLPKGWDRIYLQTGQEIPGRELA